MQTNHTEILEGRKHLSATVVDGTLFVSGTTGNDAIVVTQKSDNSVVVSDNGKITNLRAYSFDTISIDTGRGADKVLLNGVVLPFGGSVITGGGNDSVLLTDANINGDFLIDTGDNDDVVAFTDSSIEGGVITTGNGNDLVAGYGNTFLNYGTVQTGSGNDAVILAKTVTFGFTTIDTGSGFDTFIGVKNNFPGGVATLNTELKIII